MTQTNIIIAFLGLSTSALWFYVGYLEGRINRIERGA